MNILLTGINNYLGKKLASSFLEEGHQVACLVRSETLFLKNTENNPNLSMIRGDLIREKYSVDFPDNLDVAYYFSLYAVEQADIYQELELLALQNYIKKLRRVNCTHLVYVIPLRSPVNEEVEALLKENYIYYTIVRTSNIVGKSSILMRIFKHMSSKLAIIATARLAKSRCQPISLRDALIYLNFIALNPAAFNQRFDIGGPEILSYREMLDSYLQMNKVKKVIITLPFLHDAFTSFWLSRSSGIPKAIAKAFSTNIQGDILCEDNRIHELFPHKSLKFREALREAEIGYTIK